MTLPVTAVAASVLGFLYVVLALKVVGFRRKHMVSVGDGGHEDLLRAIRIQGNLAEYAPVALVLLACLELNSAPVWLTAALALAFVGGRLMHPYGMKTAQAPMRPRVLGMQLTLFSIIGMGLANLVMVAAAAIRALSG